MYKFIIIILLLSYIHAFYIPSLLIQTNIDKHRNLYRYCSKLSKRAYITNKNPIYDTRVNFIINNNTLYIYFRGTSSLHDWKINLDARLKLYQKNNNTFKIHNGFYTQYNSVKKYIYSYLIENNSYDNIIITGHSLGGALATICSFDISDYIYNKNITCVTFGSPRVGDKNFINLYNYYNISTHRIVIYDDPVPKWPLNGNYIHICSSIYFKKNKIFIKPNKGLISIKRFLIYLFSFDYNIQSHNIENYIKIIET
tara:strand:- start:1706 stop:2470 length:765 start_codon:yes stop_codon:yes gene_type:complete